MSKLVITTVGASLLEKDKLKGVKGWIDTKTENDIDNLIAGNVITQRNYDKIVQDYFSAVTDLRDYSAEIASLKLMKLNRDEDRVVLLFSDTPEGAFCARGNAIYINEHIAQCESVNGTNKDVRKIRGLKIDTAKDFILMGLNNLRAIVVDLFKNKRDKDEIYFNFTGGYKGEIPLITILAKNWFNGVPLFYLFEPKNKKPELIKMIVKENKIEMYTGKTKEIIEILPNGEVEISG